MKRTQRRLHRIFFCWLALVVLTTPVLPGLQQENRKPLVVVVYADWCPLCQKLKPTLARINEDYKDQIHFVRLDVTSPATTLASRQEAQKFGLESFFDRNRERTSLVIIQGPTGHEVFRAMHDYDFQHYAAVLDQLLRSASAKPAGH